MGLIGMPRDPIPLLTSPLKGEEFLLFVFGEALALHASQLCLPPFQGEGRGGDGVLFPPRVPSKGEKATLKLSPFLSALLGWNVLDARYKRRVHRCVDRPVFHLGARRKRSRIVVALPVVRRPDRPG